MLVTVARRYTDFAVMRVVLAAAYSRHSGGVLVHGDCPQGDRTAARIWRELGGVDEPHPVDWNVPCRLSCNHGPRRPWRGGITSCQAAGQYRNHSMVLSGVVETLSFLAPGSHGAKSTTRLSRARGLPTFVWQLGQGAESRPEYLLPEELAELVRVRHAK